MTGTKDDYQLTLQTIFVVVQACEQHDEWREYIIFFLEFKGANCTPARFPLPVLVLFLTYFLRSLFIGIIDLLIYVSSFVLFKILVQMCKIISYV
jgi:hypothetical protein